MVADNKRAWMQFKILKPCNLEILAWKPLKMHHLYMRSFLVLRTEHSFYCFNDKIKKMHPNPITKTVSLFIANVSVLTKYYMNMLRWKRYLESLTFNRRKEVYLLTSDFFLKLYRIKWFVYVWNSISKLVKGIHTKMAYEYKLPRNISYLLR